MVKYSAVVINWVDGLQVILCEDHQDAVDQAEVIADEEGLQKVNLNTWSDLEDGGMWIEIIETQYP